MKEQFEIFGTLIPFKTIEIFRIEQKEYIYRPVYREKEDSFFKTFSRSKYEFYQMQPYAAILDEPERKGAVRNYNPLNFVEAVGKDLVDGVFSAAGEVANMVFRVIIDAI